MTLSLAGIIVVQYLWIKKAFEVKEELFNQSVITALNETVKKTERDKNAVYVRKKILGTQQDTLIAEIYDSLGRFTLIEHLTDSIPNDIFTVGEDEDNTIIINNGGNNDIYSFNYKTNNKKSHTVILLDSLHKTIKRNHYLWVSEVEDSLQLILRTGIEMIEDKKSGVDKAISNLSLEIESLTHPDHKSLHKSRLEFNLNSSLKDQGINLPYEYALYDKEGDSVLTIRSVNFVFEGLENVYAVTLFPDKMLSESELLLLSLHGKNTYITGKLGLMLGGSVFFTLIILFTFGITLYTILRQKRISEIKSDFINNMNHEFKTPIATISLAVDSIKNRKIITDPDRISDLADIIEEENKKMNNKVENVLQMALADNKDFHLYKTGTNIHNIISSALKNIELQVEKREGNITTTLNADPYFVNGDSVHLRNVLINLLDNANLYSPEKPEISVNTSNDDSYIKISISDNGIGIKKEYQHKIFDKFFRVSSGNIHNVKGSGLGLSYSKAIVEAHDGTISVESIPGKGSTFIIRIPFIQRNSEE